jgi:hypothetical protein
MRNCNPESTINAIYELTVEARAIPKDTGILWDSDTLPILLRNKFGAQAKLSSGQSLAKAYQV